MRLDLARAVIDASGTWHNAKPAWRGGSARDRRRAFRRTASPTAFPTSSARDRSDLRRAPRPRGRGRPLRGEHSARSRASRRTRSAISALIWAVRSTQTLPRVRRGAADKLPARGKLGSDLKHLVDSGRLSNSCSGFQAEAHRRGSDRSRDHGQHRSGTAIRSDPSTASSWRPASGPILR